VQARRSISKRVQQTLNIVRHTFPSPKVAVKGIITNEQHGIITLQ
jgi:hypothetical protein